MPKAPPVNLLRQKYKMATKRIHPVQSKRDSVRSFDLKVPLSQAERDFIKRTYRRGSVPELVRAFLLKNIRDSSAGAQDEVAEMVRLLVWIGQQLNQLVVEFDLLSQSRQDNNERQLAEVERMLCVIIEILENLSNQILSRQITLPKPE